MKNLLTIAATLCFLMIFGNILQALPYPPPQKKLFPETAKESVFPEDATNKVVGKNPKEIKKEQRKLQKAEKHIEKFQKKLEKKQKRSGDFWNSNKFRLGAMLLIVALAIGILSIFINLGGIISAIASIFAIGGLVFIIWALVEYAT